MILFLKFKKQGQLLFLDQNIQIEIDPKQKYFIVLSPSLYWVKKVTLPLKYVHEVKKIAATLFEEILPAGNYSFYVVKEGDAFFVFAYEDAALLSLLSKKGLSLSQITAISFAQFAFDDLEEPLLVDQQTILMKKDGIVLLLPAALFTASKRVSTSDMQASKQTIQLEQFSHIVDAKTLYKVAALLLLFIGVLFGEYLYFLKQKDQIENSRDNLFASYKLKPTLMQNRAILEKYQRADLKEQKLRKYIDYFLKAKYINKEKIVAINYNGSVLSVEIAGIKGNVEKRLLSQFYKEKIKLNTRYKADNLIVEVKV